MASNRAERIPGSKPARSAVAYIRASTKKQNLSCDDQLTSIGGYCDREGLRLAKVFRDDGVSGTRGRDGRSGWDDLLSYVESGNLAGGVVVVWSLNRWARDFRDGLMAAWTVGDYDVELHTTDKGRVEFDSLEGQVLGAMELALAAKESRERSRIVRARKALHLDAGYWVTRPPYGYALKGPRGRKILAPDPIESKIVLEIFERFDAGETYGAIAGDLTARGLSSRQGNEWSPPSLRTILAGWSYGGFWRSRTNAGPVRKINCETFIPRDLWERCRQRAEGKGGKIARRTKYPLSGLVLCGVCTRRMRVHTWPARDGGSRKGYKCPGRITGRCDNPTVGHLELLEAGVLAWWREMLAGEGPDKIAREVIAQEHAEAIAAAMRRWPMEDELKDLEAQELRLVDAIRVTGLSPIIEGELELVRERRAVVEDQICESGPVVLPLVVEDAVRELEEEILAVDSPRALRGWIDEIIIQPDREVTVRGLDSEGVFII